VRNFPGEGALTPSESPLAKSPRFPCGYTEQRIGRGREKQGVEAAGTLIWSTCVLWSTHALVPRHRGFDGLMQEKVVTGRHRMRTSDERNRGRCLNLYWTIDPIGPE
jgi:hypothetical protein